MHATAFHENIIKPETLQRLQAYVKGHEDVSTSRQFNNAQSVIDAVREEMQCLANILGAPVPFAAALEEIASGFHADEQREAVAELLQDPAMTREARGQDAPKDLAMTRGARGQDAHSPAMIREARGQDAHSPAMIREARGQDAHRDPAMTRESRGQDAHRPAMIRETQDAHRAHKDRVRMTMAHRDRAVMTRTLMMMNETMNKTGRDA
ncbi:hypothetical protein HDU90_003601 [Geranomyces variabilis]|nr:hypothetical protein HDU90_003601 [Geranomyces variabilis]